MKYKITIFLISITAVAVTQSCRTPKKVETQQEAVSEHTETEENDTTTVVRDIVITTTPTSDGGNRQTINEKTSTITHKNKRKNNQVNTRTEQITEDRLTPKVQNIENKAKKDSMNHELKMKKQEVKVEKWRLTFQDIKRLMVVALLFIIILYILKRK